MGISSQKLIIYLHELSWCKTCFICISQEVIHYKENYTHVLGYVGQVSEDRFIE